MASRLEEMAAWLPACLPSGKGGVKVSCPFASPHPPAPQTHRTGELLQLLPGQVRGGAELLGVSVSLCLQGAGSVSPPRPWHPQCQPLRVGDARWASLPGPCPHLRLHPAQPWLTEPVFASFLPQGIGSSPGSLLPLPPGPGGPHSVTTLPGLAGSRTPVSGDISALGLIVLSPSPLPPRPQLGSHTDAHLATW